MKITESVLTTFSNEHLVFSLESKRLVQINSELPLLFGVDIGKDIKNYEDFKSLIDASLCDEKKLIDRSFIKSGDQVFSYSVLMNHQRIHLKEICWVNFQTATFHVVFYVQNKKFFELSYRALIEIVHKTETPTILFNETFTEVLAVNSATLPILNDQVSNLVGGFSIHDFFIEAADFERVLRWKEAGEFSMLTIESKLLLGGGQGTWFNLNLYRINPEGTTLILVILQNINTQKSVELKLHRTNELLTRVVEVQGHFLLKSTDSNPYELLLANILNVIDAEIGFVGKVTQGAGGNKMLRIHAASDISDQSKEAFDLYQKHVKNDFLFRHLDNLFGACIVESKIILENNPSSNPHTKGVKVPGHPNVQNFLGVPILKGQEVIGLIGLGNKEGGFSNEDVLELSPFISTYSLIIEAIKFEKEKIQFEKESQVKAKILSNVADHSPDLIVVMNSNNELEFISSSSNQFFDNDLDSKEIEICIKDLMDQTISPEYEISNGKYRSTLPLKYSKKEEYWVESNVNLLHEEQEKKIIAVIRDVSIQKDFETRLIKSLEKERQFSEFVYDFINVISHEFKTPLATILSSMELTKYYISRMGITDETSKLTSHCRKMELELENLFNLVNQSLDYDRFITNNPTLKKEKVVFETFIKNILVSKEYQDKVWFSSTLDEGFTIMIDQFLIETSIVNLMSNALKYGSGKKAPIIHLYTKGKKLGIRIKDFGLGILENELPYIFTPFYRGSNASGKEGTGFGLVAVKNFIELHEGEIEIQSKVGKGTTATIYLKLDGSK